jgi:hypothetical protein
VLAKRSCKGWLALLVAVGAGCGSGSVDVPGDPDGSASDARPSVDSGPRPDARPAVDAGPAPDARPPGNLCEPTGDVRTAPAFGPPTVTTSGLLVRVMNNCPFSLWMHGQGGNGSGGVNILQPDDAQLTSGSTRDYDAGQFFGSARVTAYRNGPRQNEIQFVEMHYERGTLGYNISYVDYLGLPVEVTADCGTTACYAPVADALDGCPAHLDDGDRCRSAGSFCSAPPNRSNPYCSALDADATAALSVPRCRDDLQRWLAGGGSMDRVGRTPAVYACTDFWASSAFCCAIVNRGVVDGDPADVCAFYEGEHNTYARWVHERCPAIYAFPYDDSGDQGGFHQCPTRELRITWCPGG